MQDLISAYVALHSIYTQKEEALKPSLEVFKGELEDIYLEADTKVRLILDGLRIAKNELNDAICFQEPINEDWVHEEMKRYKLD